jgi:sugar phosphate isomerase/epimerase
MKSTRRVFIRQFSMGATGLGLASAWPNQIVAASTASDLFFKISLAEFSLASSILGGQFPHMEFPAKAKNAFGISAVEHVTLFFADKANDQTYLKELKQRTDDLGVQNVLIMVDTAGDLASLDENVRTRAVDNHRTWLDAAKFLGCHAIRVNLGTLGREEDPEGMLTAAVDGYGRLVAYGAENEMGVVVENHFGASTNPEWLVRVMKEVDNPAAGTLPDFGNFCEKHGQVETADGGTTRTCLLQHDPYEGTRALMPYAKGVSAKTNRFDEQGNEVDIDFTRMLQIVKDAGFTGYIGIEYGGGFMRRQDDSYLTDDEGIMATKRLLERVGAALS